MGPMRDRSADRERECAGPADAGRAGRFLVLDGIDGCGKSTQAERLVLELSARSEARVVHLREPGSTRLGESLRDLLLEPGRPIEARVEALLFAAARRHMLVERVAPALAQGADVVCERFHASTFAYQTAGGLDPDRILDLLHAWCGEPQPDLTLVLDLDPQLAADRIRERGREPDRIETRGLEFQRKVALGFREYARRDTRSRLVDAAGDPDQVRQRIHAALESASGLFTRHG